MSLPEKTDYTDLGPTYETFEEYVVNRMQSAVEYSTEHIDAGNGYHQMIREGDWQYHDGAKRLRQYLEARNDVEVLPETFMEELEECAIDECEPYSFHVFGLVGKPYFEVARFQVGEVEEQIGLDDIEQEFPDAMPEAIEDWLTRIGKSREVVASRSGNGLFCYECTDMFWSFQITGERLVERLNELKEESLTQ